MQDIVDTKLTLVSNATPNGQPNRFKNRLTFPLDATNAELALVSASLPVTYDAHEGGYLGKPVRIALIGDPASLCMTELKAYVAKTPSCPWMLLADNCFIRTLTTENSGTFHTREDYLYDICVYVNNELVAPLKDTSNPLRYATIVNIGPHKYVLSPPGPANSSQHWVLAVDVPAMKYLEHPTFDFNITRRWTLNAAKTRFITCRQKVGCKKYDEYDDNDMVFFNWCVQIHMWASGDGIGDIVFDDIYQLGKKNGNGHAFSTIFIYLDILKKRFVGNDTFKLLHYHHKPTKEELQGRSAIVIRPNPLIFYPCEERIFQELEITIADELGIPIQFKDGHVQIEIYIRQKKH